MIQAASREHPNEVFAARLEEFSAEFVGIGRERAALDAREARLLARSAAFADAIADTVVTRVQTSSERRALARRSNCATLAMAARTSEQAVQRATLCAEALVNDAPTVLGALEAGRISMRHAQVIAEQLREVPEAGRGAFLRDVLPVAEQATPTRLKQRARVMRERLHPESITVRAARSEANRRVELEPSTDGMAWIHLLTTAPVACGIMERLDAVVGEAHSAGDDRSCSQLRADALASLCISGVTTAPEPGSAGEGAPVPRPIEVARHIRATVQLTVPVLALLGIDEAPSSLDGYGPIDPETAAQLAVGAPSMTRVLIHPETGAVLSVGRDQYRVPTDLRRAVQLRDVMCRAPGCGRRARACDIDHSTAWEDGGTTSVGNLACLCRHHHRLKHLPGWRLAHQSDGALDWTTPDGRPHRSEAPPF